MKKSSLPGWLPHTALIILLLASLMRPAGMSMKPFALVAAVFAVLQSTILATPTADGSLSWGALIKSLLGPAVLPVYGLAVAGMLYVGHGADGGCGHCGTSGGGCTSCGSSGASAVAHAAPTMCGGQGCGSAGGGCGSGGCGKGGAGCGASCGAGKKTAAANSQPLNIPLPRVNMGAPIASTSNLPGLNGPGSRPLPAGLVPKGGAAMPPGVAPAAGMISSPPPTTAAAVVNLSPATPVATASGANLAPVAVIPPATQPVAPVASPSPTPVISPTAPPIPMPQAVSSSALTPAPAAPASTPTTPSS